MPRCTARCTTWSTRLGLRPSALLLALLVVGAPAPARAQSDWAEEVDALLARRARAVRSSDERAFRATVRGAPAAFVRSQVEWFERFTALPVSGYSLERDLDGYEDLAPAAEVTGERSRIVTVIQRFRLGAFDPRPAAEVLYLMVAPIGGRWSIVADDALEDLGLFSTRNVWDFAPVATTETERVLAIHHDGDGVRALAVALGEALEDVRGTWPLAVPNRTVLVIPRSAVDLGRIFSTTVDLSPFVAFAASTTDLVEGRERSGGSRVYLQPETYFRQPPSFQAEVLTHEMTHVAASTVRGPFIDTWLEEGVAQLYGERGPSSTARLDAQVRAGTFPARLPEDHRFFLGGSESINAMYEAAADLAAFLAGRYGRDAPARYYAELGSKSPVSLGTPRYHQDRAAREVFGVSIDVIERRWLRSIGVLN